MRKTARDDLQRELTYEFPPRRIISLCPSLTETLFTLGLGDRIVGRTDFCVEPTRAVSAVPTVGGPKNIDVKRVGRLNPDLIIAAKEENTEATVASLATRLPVYVVEVTDVASTLRAISNLGELTDRTSAAGELVAAIRCAIGKLRPRTRRRVAYLVWRAPYRAVGAETYIHALLYECGFENVCARLAGRYPELSLAALRELAPEYVLLGSEPYPFTDNHVGELVAELPTSKVMCVDGQMFGWYGSRLLLAADYLSNFIGQLGE
ncbi:MAG: ABC transporter substrate-binding protein [Planctomycetes bacterium]|nr:ABC transporter substrate-binding protein [Planctomycetota bacterium]